jgi:hypothetical protein
MIMENCMQQQKSMVKVGGIYRHYKNKCYRVIGIGRHSETHEDMIVYQALYESPEFGDNAFWIRPLGLFLEEVMVNGQRMPRFALVEEK